MVQRFIEEFTGKLGVATIYLDSHSQDYVMVFNKLPGIKIKYYQRNRIRRADTLHEISTIAYQIVDKGE